MIMEVLEANSKLLIVFLGVVYFLGYYRGKAENQRKAGVWFDRVGWLLRKQFPNVNKEVL